MAGGTEKDDFGLVDLGPVVAPVMGANFRVGIGEAREQKFTKPAGDLKEMQVPPRFVYLEYVGAGDVVRQQGIPIETTWPLGLAGADIGEDRSHPLNNDVDKFIRAVASAIVGVMNNEHLRGFTIASVDQNHPVAVKLGSSPERTLNIVTVKIGPVLQDIVNDIRLRVMEYLGNGAYRVPVNGGVIRQEGISKKDIGNPNMR